MSKVTSLKLCFLILLALNFELHAQSKPTFAFSSKQFVTRTGYFGGISASIAISRIEVEVETGFNWLRLMQYGHYAPYVGLQINANLIEQEKLSIMTGADYFMTLRRFPKNKASNAHSLFYQYRLIYGKKWQFLQELGVGGTLMNRFPESNQLIWDIKILVGVRYVL